MIRLLLALHPRAWRARYGEEFRALLEASPATAAVILDVALNAVRQHAAVHAAALRLLAALAVFTVVEVVAVRTHVTDNILWPPSTLPRTLALIAVLMPWLPVATDLAATVARRRRAARSVSR